MMFFHLQTPTWRETSPRPGATALIGLLVLGLLLTTRERRSSGSATSVPLGTADSFAVLAGSGITNTGPTTSAATSGRIRRRPIPVPRAITRDRARIHAGDAVTQGRQDRPDHRLQHGGGRQADVPIAADLGGQTLTRRGLQLRLVDRAHRSARPSTAAEPERRLRLPGGLDAHHRVGQPRSTSSTAPSRATSSGRSGAPRRSAPAPRSGARSSR